jgi:hypothetical protein
MVFIMKHINYLLLLISILFIYALLITTPNQAMTIQTQSLVYASEEQQQKGNDQEEQSQTPPENNDDSEKANSESESSQQGGTADSDQSKSNSNRNDDLTSTNQNSNCPINPENSVSLYIGQGGCQYPCPSVDSSNNDQNTIPEGCPIEPLSSQANTGSTLKKEGNPTTITSSQEQQQPNSQDNLNQNAFVSPSINSDTTPAGFSVKGEGNPTQSPSQEQQQQVEQPQGQQNGQDSLNQNTFVSPSINSDTGTTVSNSEAPSTTSTISPPSPPQKSITSAGKLRSGTTQTESILPSLNLGYDPSKSQTPGGDLAKRGTSNGQNEAAKPYEPGSEKSQIGDSLLGKNPQVPPNPGKIPSEREGIKDAFVSVEVILGGPFAQQYRVADYDVCVDTATEDIYGEFYYNSADPPCSVAHSPITIFKVQAPGSIFIHTEYKSPIVDSQGISDTCIGKEIQPGEIIMCKIQEDPFPMDQYEYYASLRKK